MKLQDIKSEHHLSQYIEGLVNDFQGVEMQSDVTDKTIQMYKDIADLCIFVGKKAQNSAMESTKKKAIELFYEGDESADIDNLIRGITVEDIENK